MSTAPSASTASIVPPASATAAGPSDPTRPPRPRPLPYGRPGHAPAPITRRVDDVALVFEGGGMRGTYTAALVQVLLEAGLFRVRLVRPSPPAGRTDRLSWEQDSACHW